MRENLRMDVTLNSIPWKHSGDDSRWLVNIKQLLQEALGGCDHELSCKEVQHQIFSLVVPRD
ncbi:hypothetical protein ABKV19_008666 [Rosa sericea]